MGKPWRLILDQKNNGYYNMAVDKAICLSYPLKKIPTLRIYGWSKPFVTLGYNQKQQEVLNSDSAVPFTRRITGGSSILHHQELTYSLTCSRDDLKLPSKIKELYKVLCSFLIYFYSHLGLKADFAQDIFSSGLGRYSNFCFSSYEHFDLVINKKKIGGNAQRHRRDVIFQQGSIPQEIDFDLIRRTINNPGNLEDKTISLNTLLSKKTDFNKLSLILAESFQKVFKVEFTPLEASLFNGVYA